MICNWYNNLNGQKSRKAASGHVKLDILRPRGRRALQAIEIYSRKYYAERVKPLVEAAKCNLDGKATRSERMKIVRDCLKEAYKNESRKVREEIEAERLAQNRGGDNSDDSGDETSNEDDESHGTVVNAVKRQAYVTSVYQNMGVYLLLLAHWTTCPPFSSKSSRRYTALLGGSLWFSVQEACQAKRITLRASCEYLDERSCSNTYIHRNLQLSRRGGGWLWRLQHVGERLQRGLCAAVPRVRQEVIW